MASIRDVAKLAQVAPSTVSLVLNNTGYVAEATRRRVRQAMEDLHYVPNELARNLYKKRTNMVGVIVPDVSHPFFGTFVRFVEMELYERGYTTMLCSTVQKKNGELEFIERLRRHMIDGIVMGAHSLTLDEYEKIQRPVVALDRELGARIPIVGADHHAGGVLAAERLLRSGCRRAVQIMGTRSVTTPAHEHHFSFEKTMTAGGARVDTFEMEWNQFGPEYFRYVAMGVFEQYSDTDAIFATDLVVAACLQRARQLGIAVPERMKMIAYDGTYITRMSERVLTAVVQPIDAIARLVAESMARLIEGEAVRTKAPLAVSLQEGETA